MLYAEAGQDRIEPVQTLILDYWKDYIEDNWLSGGDNMDGGEVRVKRMLDACGYFLLRNIDTDGVITEYKDKANTVREIPISSSPEIVSDALYSAVKHGEYYNDSGGYDIAGKNADILLGPPKKRFEKRTRFDKILEAKSQYPGCSADWQLVDTTGCFWHEDKMYRVHSEVAAYKPKPTKIGMYYSADSVLVLSGDNGLRFYTQEIEPLVAGEDVLPTGFTRN